MYAKTIHCSDCGAECVAGRRGKRCRPCRSARKRMYDTWHDMVRRCTDPGRKDFIRYGGRGIAVCARWLGSFETFLSDVGLKPAGLSIDRIDNSGHYEPGNCQWATRSQQQLNRRRDIAPPNPSHPSQSQAR